MLKRMILKAAAFLLAAVLAVPALAQTYPINNPTYIPTAILAPTTATTTGTVSFMNNGNSTILIRVAGTFSVLSATVQVTESRATSPSWTTVSAQTVGGSRVGTLTATGLYRVNVAGAAQVRINIATLTGTNVILSAAATPGPEFMQQLPATRATYAAAATITPVATPSDLMIINGSSTKVVRVNTVQCTGTAGGTGNGTLVGYKRSTANSGTSTAATGVALDSSNTTPAAVVVTFAANPTQGTTVGAVRISTLPLAPATNPALPIVWNFASTPSEQGIVLRSAAEGFAIGGNSVSMPASASLNCAISWTEE